MKTKKFLPIEASPVVVEDGPTCIGTILASPHHHAARLRPPTLDPFAIRSTGSFCVVEIINDLTAVSVARQMKFRHDDFPIVKILEVK